MQVKYSKDSSSFKFFQDYWKYVQYYGEPEENDEFWEQVVDVGVKLADKYGNQKFHQTLILAHLDELERKAKKERMKKRSEEIFN